VAGYGEDTIAIILFYFKRFLRKFLIFRVRVRIRVRVLQPENPFQNSEISDDRRQEPIAAAK